jgi:vitamin K-dependent gamma-carboxylase
VIQLALPLRFLLYPGDVNWTEDAFRFSWRVMLVEKAGSVELAVETAQPARRFTVHPARELSALQYKMMSTQPDMIHEYALAVAERLRAGGHAGIAIHADAWASLNGRPSQRLIDPRVNLAAVPRSLAAARWVEPLVSVGGLR